MKYLTASSIDNGIWYVDDFPCLDYTGTDLLTIACGYSTDFVVLVFDGIIITHIFHLN